MNSYFVVYDNDDNIVCYLHNLIDLVKFTGLRVKDINYKFKNNDYICVNVDKQLLNVYKFC